MIIESPSGWVYDSSQENGDQVDCRACGNTLNDDLPIYTNHDGYAFCSEACILFDHDVDEELHAYVPKRDEDHEAGEDQSWSDYDSCKECGDTEEGLMHNNTERNVEPLLYNVPDCGNPGPDCSEHNGECD